MTVANIITDLPACISQLDYKQRAATLDINGQAVIHAKPGAGKTRVIASRVALLLNKGIPQENILCFTFTNKAADEMKQRIETYSGQQINGMWVGTFHSICAKILRQYAPKNLVSPNFSICDDAQSTRIINSAIFECCSDYNRYIVSEIKARISLFKRGLMDLDDWCEDLEQKLGESYAWRFNAIYSKYQAELRRVKALDFDDLTLNTVRLLQDKPDIQQMVSSRFHYICVDEYQDSADIEAELIRLLSTVQGNLCVVGDVNQAVYGWRGSNHRMILDFHKSYPGAKIHTLDTNYRSGRSIVAAAESLISDNGGKANMSCKPAGSDEGEVLYTRYISDAQEAGAIAKIIQDMVSSGEAKCCEVAVLARMHALLRPVHKALSKHNIPSATIQSSEDIETPENAVQLMTIHQAKGLEFRVVFLIGLEEGILPCSHSLFNDEALEEERRLCYVAMTRAIDSLYLSSCHTRSINGRKRELEESRFIVDIQGSLPVNKKIGGSRYDKIYKFIQTVCS